jgi:hypothetical protein
MKPRCDLLSLRAQRSNFLLIGGQICAPTVVVIPGDLIRGKQSHIFSGSNAAASRRQAEALPYE